MKMRRKIILIVIFILVLTTSVQAQLSGSQIITVESDPVLGPIIIYTSVLDYSMNDNLNFTLITDRHPVAGLDIDLSVTRYFLNIFYTTAGIRKGIRDSKTGWTPYFMLSYYF